MDHLAFSGDMPVGIKYMHLLALRLEKMGVKGQIVGVFHGKAAYMTLNDKTYNAVRKVDTGNPYKGPIAELIKQGVQVEECVVSMKAHGWVNADLLPGVKVNGGAVARLVQLGQEGTSRSSLRRPRRSVAHLGAALLSRNHQSEPGGTSLPDPVPASIRAADYVRGSLIP